MADRYADHAANLTSPASGAFAIVPHDTNTLPETTRALYVGQGGDLTVEMQWGGIVSFSNLPDAALLPIRVGKVLAATTAASIVGLF